MVSLLPSLSLVPWANFTVPTSKHISYQGSTFLPYFVKRYIGRDKSAKLKPLYNLEEIGGIEKDAEYVSSAVGASH